MLERRTILLLLALGLVVLAAPVAARADGGNGRTDVRVERSCSDRSTLRLRVRAREERELRVELDVRTPRRGAVWSTVLIHERRLVWRTRTRTGSSSGSFSRRLVLPDWPGRDTVTVRAIGPGGEVCRAVVVVDDPVSG